MSAAHDIPLDALRANHSAAWEVAYPLLWRCALGAVLTVLGPTRADAENVAADILAKEIVPGILRPRTDSFNQISTFDDLLHVIYSISKNRAIDFVRRSARRPEVLMDVVPDLPLDPAGHAPPDLMEQVLRHLQPPDPELFHDRFVLGHTTREIAAIRNMSHGTVVSRFARALEKLRHLLKEDLEP